MRPSELPKRENGDKRPHVGLRILQEGSKERGSLVGKGDQAKPCRNVLWACIQDPNHRLVVTLTWRMGTQRWHPPEPPPAWFLPPMLSRPSKHLPSGFDQALVGSSDVPTGSLLQLYRIHPWSEVSPLGSWGTALLTVSELYRMLL